MDQFRKLLEERLDRSQKGINAPDTYYGVTADAYNAGQQEAFEWVKDQLFPEESETLEGLLAFCRENNRVCLWPNQWQKLWEMLPSSQDGPLFERPPVPLILAAWFPPGDAVRLAEQIKWAAKHGSLEEVGKYLRGLQEKDWTHVGD